tara:strand:- start:655 stop:933 length:279 start_codon:yes stop_codon:yes gene_type:complete
MIENVQQLLSEQLGKNGSTEVYKDGGGFTGKDFYCIYFPLETVVASISVADVTVGEGYLVNTYAAGTTLFMNVTDMSVTSGLAICYHEGPTT